MQLVKGTRGEVPHFVVLKTQNFHNMLKFSKSGVKSTVLVLKCKIVATAKGNSESSAQEKPVGRKIPNSPFKCPKFLCKK